MRRCPFVFSSRRSRPSNISKGVSSHLLQGRNMSANKKTEGPERVIDYLPADIGGTEFIERLKHRRGGHLLNLDRILLHSPNLAEGWNSMFATLRGDRVTICAKYKELAICAVAVLNEAEYEFYQHERPWRDAGATSKQVAEIRNINSGAFDRDAFDEMELKVIQLTIEMTKNVKVTRELMISMRDVLGAQALVELVSVISGYNMVSRFLVALDITAEGEPVAATSTSSS